MSKAIESKVDNAITAIRMILQDLEDIKRELNKENPPLKKSRIKSIDQEVLKTVQDSFKNINKKSPGKPRL